MSDLLKKEDTLFERNNDGKLIPQEVELIINENSKEQKEYKGKIIRIIPMSRGDIKEKIFSKSDDEIQQDNRIILEHCIEPKYEESELTVASKPGLVPVIVNTIMYYSGIDVTKTWKKVESAVKEEDDFSKNLEKQEQSDKKVN